MGVSLEAARQRIGCRRSFSPRAFKIETEDHMTTRINRGPGSRPAVWSCAALSWQMLTVDFTDIARCGDVELNPGPTGPTTTAQSTPPLPDNILKSLKDGTCVSVELQHPLKNKHILQLYSLRKANPETRWVSTVAWMQLLLSDFPTDTAGWDSKLSKSWSKLRQTSLNLRKSVGRETGRKRFAEWEECVYELPKVIEAKVLPPPTLSSADDEACITDEGAPVVECSVLKKEAGDTAGKVGNKRKSRKSTKMAKPSAESLEEEVEDLKHKVQKQEETIMELMEMNQELTDQLQVKKERAKEERAKEERAKEESVKEESAKEESAKEESAKEESAKEESVKEESVKEEHEENLFFLNM